MVALHHVGPCDRGGGAVRRERPGDGVGSGARYLCPGQRWQSYRAGVALIPDRGDRIENFPERLVNHWPDIPLHYENGVRKNDRTTRRFKGVVRIVKKLRNNIKYLFHSSQKWTRAEAHAFVRRARDFVGRP